MNWFAKAIWALDAFHDEPESDARVLQMARALFGSRLEIEPVFVLRPGQLEPLHDEFVTPESASARGIAALEQFFARVPGLGEPRVLTARGTALRDATHTLADYAARSRADVILVATHGRRGLARLAQGSFAETLLHDAATPVCIYHHRATAVASPKRILYPTDLSPASLYVFRAAVSQLASLGIPLTLLHHTLPRLATPVMTPHPFLLPTPSVDLFLENDQALRQTAQEWIALARRHGISADFRFSSEADSVSDWILRKAQDCGNGLLVMEAHRGRVASALFGNRTHQVVRESHCPVLVYPAKVAEAAERDWQQAG